MDWIASDRIWLAWIGCVRIELGWIALDRVVLDLIGLESHMAPDSSYLVRSSMPLHGISGVPNHGKALA